MKQVRKKCPYGKKNKGKHVVWKKVMEKMRVWENSNEKNVHMLK